MNAVTVDLKIATDEAAIISITKNATIESSQMMKTTSPGLQEGDLKLKIRWMPAYIRPMHGRK